jgi:16S rRNA (guanine1516-N2)-methyltransferase
LYWVRTDLFVTTSQRATSVLLLRAEALAAELECPVEKRGKEALENLFGRLPDADRALIVQGDRLLLESPNMAALRLKNLRIGQRDLLLDATRLEPGDSVLDATLGYAGEATLCSWATGVEVHGIEAVPEVGVVLRDGLQTTTTHNATLNAAMRRVKVVHLGHHLDFLQACPAKTYDVVCFDPFFDAPTSLVESLVTLKAFGDHRPLLPETLAEAVRVARKRVIVKAARHSSLLDTLGIQEWVTSKQSKLVYGVVNVTEVAPKNVA